MTSATSWRVAPTLSAAWMWMPSSLGRCSTVSAATAQSSRCFCEITSRLYITPVKKSERSRASALSKRFQCSKPTSLWTPLKSVALVRLVFSRIAGSSMSPMAESSLRRGDRPATRHEADHLTRAATGCRPCYAERERIASMLNPHIFRAYDVRGRVGSDINPDVFRQVGRAYGTLIRRKGGRSIAAGRDNRESSSGLHAGFVEGVRAAGLDVVDIGQVTTPMLY